MKKDLANVSPRLSRLKIGLIGLFCLACWDLYDRWDRRVEMALESKLEEALIESRQRSARKFDIQSLTEKQIWKICFQSPYESQLDFENLVGRAVPSFRWIDDSEHVLWVFFEDGKAVCVDLSIADLDLVKIPNLCS